MIEVTKLNLATVQEIMKAALERHGKKYPG
jgi:hypothetical protein